MVVSSSNRVRQYNGNGAATQFTFDFQVFSSAHFYLTKTDTSGNDSALTLGVHYSISGIGDAAGITVTYPLSGDPLATGEKITGYRITPHLQENDLQNGAAYDADVFERSFDNLTHQVQELAEDISRAPKAPITSGEINGEAMYADMIDAKSTAQQAISQSEQALSYSQNANSNAEAAYAKSEDAVSTADSADDKANTALSQSGSALTQSAAALAKSVEAESYAGSALAKSNEAKNESASAQTASAAANATADDARTVALAAQSTAQSADSKSNTANDKADGAIAQANTAAAVSNATSLDSSNAMKVAMQALLGFNALLEAVGKDVSTVTDCGHGLAADAEVYAVDCGSGDKMPGIIVDCGHGVTSYIPLSVFPRGPFQIIALTPEDGVIETSATVTTDKGVTITINYTGSTATITMPDNSIIDVPAGIDPVAYFLLNYEERFV